MLSLIIKIFFCLLVSAILGMLLGWYLRQRSARKQIMDARINMQNSLSDERAKFVSLEAEHRHVLLDLDAQRDDADKARKELDVTQRELIVRHEQDLQDRVAALTVEHHAEVARIREEGNPEKTQALLSAATAKSEDDLQKARLDIQRMGARLVDIDRRFTARNIEMDDLVGKLASAEAELQNLRANANPAASLVVQAEQQRTQAHLQVADIERRMQDVTLAAQQKVEQQNQQHASEMEAAMAQVQARVDENDRLQAELNDVRAEFAALRLHAAQKEQMVDRHSDETERLNLLLSAAQTELGDREARLSQVQMQVANQDFEIATMRNEVKVKDAQLTDLSASMQARVYELDRVRAELMRRDQGMHERQEIVGQYEREVAALMAQRDRLQEELNDAASKAQAKIQEVQAAGAQREALLQAAQARAFEADAALHQYRENSYSFDGKLERYQTQVLQQESLLAQKETEIVKMRADFQLQLDEARSRAANVAVESQRAAETWREAAEAEQFAREELRRIRSELAISIEQRQGIQLQLDNLRADSTTLRLQAQRDLSAAQLRAQEAEARLRLQEGTLNAELQQLRFELAKRDAVAAEVKRKPSTLPAWGAEKPREIDDLQLIWGVGPKLEKMLHELGIWTFRQIAAWTKRDITEVDDRLEAFHGRIQRDGWVASAKAEHFKKYGEKV